MEARLVKFQQGKMDLKAHTEHRLMDQKETRIGEVLPNRIVNRPRML